MFPALEVIKTFLFRLAMKTMIRAILIETILVKIYVVVLYRSASFLLGWIVRLLWMVLAFWGGWSHNGEEEFISAVDDSDVTAIGT